jgi:hypothetical protein
MKCALQVLSGVVGLVAAALWFMSAAVPLPLTPGAAIGGTLPTNPFNVALRHSASLNEWAAAATGVSVLLSVAALAADPLVTALRRLMRSPPQQ